MTDIFISYSHENEDWKDELKSHLSVLETHGDFSIWEDRQIEPGNDWYEEIQKAIRSAKVAILLVSREFLTSDFVKREEIPELLKRRETGGLRIIPLIVKPCAWETVPWLAELQGATKNNEPLSKFKLGSFEAELILSQFVKVVDKLLKAALLQEQLQQKMEEIVEESELYNTLNQSVKELEEGSSGGGLLSGSLSKALRSCRAQVGLTIEAAASEMKLPIGVLAALESEDFKSLPTLPYVRVHLRSYARLNQSDPEHLIQLLDDILAQRRKMREQVVVEPTLGGRLADFFKEKMPF